MKYFTYLTILFISVSCQTKLNKQANFNNLYSVDTVIIDSKESLLDLESNIFKSDLNERKSSIFLFNKFKHLIDEVDLDNLEFVNNYPFDSDGPDGTGEYVNDIYEISDSLFFIKSFNRSALFHKNGTLIYKINWTNSIDSNGLKFGKIPQKEIAVGLNDLKVFGLSFENKNREVFLDILSVKDNSVERFDIDSEKSYHNFVLEIDDPQNYTFMDPIVYLTSENDQIIISHQYSSEIFIFNGEGEYLKTLKCEPSMTPNRASDLKGKSFHTIEQIEEEYQKLLEQVTFAPPVWDGVNKRYFRLSATRIFKEGEAKGTLHSELQEIKVYLSVFDSDFNLTSEVLVPELTTEFVKYFSKDGKLWVFENLADELGFIVIDI
ncbi:DUF4221 family protein [Fontibacter flavus]|uniref:DUF4221 family protein n=1 Tax=Fontibacter flavus TaxID=654838 RepID=A0ABV6FPV5_9BACT